MPSLNSTPQPGNAALKGSGRGTKRQRAQVQLGSVHSQHHQRKEGSQQAEAAEQTSPLSSAPDSSAKHTKRLKAGSAVTGSGQHQQAVPGSRAPADIHRSKKGKLKTSQEAASAKAQQAGTPPQPTQLASPIRAVPDSPAQGRKRQKRGPPDAGAASSSSSSSSHRHRTRSRIRSRSGSAAPSPLRQQQQVRQKVRVLQLLQRKARSSQGPPSPRPGAGKLVLAARLTPHPQQLLEPALKAASRRLAGPAACQTSQQA